MSIVIKGMDMPEGNSTKNLLIYSDGRVFTGHKDDANYFAEELSEGIKYVELSEEDYEKMAEQMRKNSLILTSAQPERLTDDDFETIRIHLSAFKEQLCNQRRWKEAEEYQRIIDRFMSFASAQPEQKKGKWIIRDNPGTGWYRVTCSECGEDVTSTIPMIGFFPNAKPLWDYCPYCGAKMEVEDDA